MPAYYERCTIYHKGLKKSKTIAALDSVELQYKCRLQYQAWDEEWNKKQERERIAHNNERSISLAKQQTEEAEAQQEVLSNYIVDYLNNTEPFQFDLIKDHSDFLTPYPSQKPYEELPAEPKREDAEFNAKPGFFTKISAKKMAAYTAENDKAFKTSHDEWEKKRDQVNRNNRLIDTEYKKAVDEWQESKAEHERKQREKNLSIDNLEARVKEKNPIAIEIIVKIMLDMINSPLDYQWDCAVEYNEKNKAIVVEAKFPVIDNIPRLKAVSYIKSKQEFKESYYSDAQVNKIYDDFTYKLVLVILHRVFSLNLLYDVIDMVVLNGIVDTIDKTTGNNISPVILSIRESKDNFSNLNLIAIDPKSWFRSSKGIAAAKIANVTPVQPIQTINREDKRFVEGYEVLDTIGEGMNLATIDWLDFENLIREVFEKEFKTYGGEVKITQASRDGGVDAVAFDPDPIRGGKIVIQAKRYTNVVGVSAVRDLYGTLINEGAMKGILVTTSYYGNDAYEFAKDKPIQLIDGAQLLGLMQRQGYKARIDLKEAKAFLYEK